MSEQDPQFVEIPTMTFRKAKKKNTQRLPLIIGAVTVALAIVIIVGVVFLL